MREPAHRWCGLLLAPGVGLCANDGARSPLGLGISVGDRGIAVGVGPFGGVGRITRTRSDVLRPRAQPDLGCPLFGS
jgi:hypothetical protein